MVRVVQALVFCVVICKSLLFICIYHFSFGYCIVGFWWPLWYTKFFVHSCMALNETPVDCGGGTHAQITLRSAKYLHIIKYLLLDNLRENRRCSQEWAIQRHWLHCKHIAQHRKLKRWPTRDGPQQKPRWTNVLGNVKQFLPLIRQPPFMTCRDSIQCYNKLKLTLKTGKTSRLKNIDLSYCSRACYFRKSVSESLCKER